ncbi:hypothetical protein SAMN05444274_101450 [Mariniphaga anaerophila]|uniref:Uncharacterized protein n=1 Tax=Mariniphaga anaerophila TaxID=1484053 RepID=A0A1M4TSR7_9BACT|nr:hypothetical protein SAMN05444274_101450 [Mariniphaga anaerophila]
MLYSIAVFFAFSNSVELASISSGPQLENTGSHISERPINLQGEPLNQETCFNFQSEVSFSNFEFQFKYSPAFLKHTEKVLSKEFTQYIFLARNFPVRLRKADLLFPFHYFW